MKRSTVLAQLAAGAAVAAVPRYAALAADTVRFATIPIDVGAQAYYAQAQDYFKKAGIDAEILSIPSGSAITSAVIGGSMDVGFSNILSLAQAHERGLPITLIASAGLYDTNHPTSVLMVAKDSPAKSARDLVGKTIAVNGLKNITQLAVEAWLDKNGGDSKTAKFIEIAFPDMPAALATHRVDAALIAEPAVAEARATARILGKPYDAIAPEFLIAGWFTTRAWAEAHPALVKKVSGILHDTATWANRNQAATADILAKATKIDPAMLHAMVRAMYGQRLDPRGIQPLIDTAVRYGLLKTGFPAQDLIDKNVAG